MIKTFCFVSWEAQAPSAIVSPEIVLYDIGHSEIHVVTNTIDTRKKF